MDAVSRAFRKGTRSSMYPYCFLPLFTRDQALVSIVFTNCSFTFLISHLGRLHVGALEMSKDEIDIESLSSFRLFAYLITILPLEPY